MAKIEKLIERLLSNPTDFTWEELVKVLRHFGFQESKTGKTSGSRRRFTDGKNRFVIHKPHPGNVLKRYMVNEAIDILKEKGKIKNE
jgi:predicted RNA binding protein YcfA (HicA-like mRNA interferase family)